MRVWQPDATDRIVSQKVAGTALRTVGQSREATASGDLFFPRRHKIRKRCIGDVADGNTYGILCNKDRPMVLHWSVVVCIGRRRRGNSDNLMRSRQVPLQLAVRNVIDLS
jgi:hypothetical protein